MKKRFLLTHGRSYVTLDLARLLYQAGHEVMVVDSHPIHMTRYSNAVKKSFTVPAPRFDPKGFITSLVDIVEAEKIDMLIPTFEEIFTLSENLAAFPKSCRVFAEPIEKLYPLHDKWLFNQKLKNFGFVYPKSHLVKTREALENTPIKRPYILKPAFSRQAQNLIMVQEGDPLPSITYEQHNPWVAQEYLQGKKYCSYSICQKGKVLAHSVYPVEVTIEGSSCVLFRPFHHPQIETWVKRFVQEENFTGQIAFDFIENEKLYAIECNPRTTSGLHLFSAEERLERAFLDQTDSCIKPKNTKGTQLLPGVLMYSWRHVSLKVFCKSLFGYPDIVFAKKDLKPFFSLPFVFLFYMQQCVKHKLSLPHLFTHDVDWNNEQKKTLECSASQGF